MSAAAAVPFVGDAFGAGRLLAKAGGNLGAKASSRALGRALEKAGHLRPANAAAHHIVAGGAREAAPARSILQKFGIGINEAGNGVFLKQGAHSGIHTSAYYQGVNEALAPATTREQVLQILESVGQDLRSGGSP